MFIALVALLVALQIADIWSTKKLLAIPGGIERVPLTRMLIEKVGFVGTAVAKVALVALVVWICWPDRFWEFVLCCVGYAAIVANNVRLLRKANRRN